MSRWLLIWWVTFPVLVGGCAFVLGGLGASIFSLVLAILAVAIAIRLEKRWGLRGRR
jgi:hypothetical protein